jgi:hypothetical protein
VAATPLLARPGAGTSLVDLLFALRVRGGDRVVARTDSAGGSLAPRTVLRGT